MPTYDYLCENCGYEFEQFQTIKSRPLRKCPVCKKASLKRLIGAGSGLIFKGSGFYATDYRSEDYKKKAKQSEETATGKTEAKTKPQTENSKPSDKTKKKST
ncbi:MAG: zinc ribbon domain-containing protein [Sedimentisphaerales bacterium]|nr:zinc ribbon domain-containing protein [Sedimentisphaerales bacterium]